MELSAIKGIGPSRLQSLRAMGIVSLRDLLYYLPCRYEDKTSATPICDAVPSAGTLVEGHLTAPPKLNRFNGLTRVTATLEDDTGRISVIWYNCQWIMDKLSCGNTYMLFGRITEKNGKRQLQTPQIVTENELTPVYRCPRSFPQKSFRKVMEKALSQLDDCCPETLPKSFRLRHQLCELNFALRQSHFPDSFDNLKIARRRLAFEQMLMYQCALSGISKKASDGIPFTFSDDDISFYWDSLSFSPTSAQRRVLEQVAGDMRKPSPMSRLVQGDVGCGKTAIAFGAIYLAAKSGFQSAMMAPTEILAMQHFENAKKVLEPLGITCCLLTGSMGAKARRESEAAISSSSCSAVFGTHALISEKVQYSNLGLVITDEQHRFGVNQRSQLEKKGQQQEKRPHVLVMSATPIPRTLSLILYGDLDISVVDELPPGRIPVKTRIVGEEKRQQMYGFLREQIKAGHQAYVVCPLVDDSDMMEDVRSVRATFDELSGTVLSGLRLGLTWGNQLAEEKSSVINSFSQGKIDVLVSTTVIEVGVNVPNATIMIVENAERFGLSQLHQLRGRVGRGSEESWCFLVAKANSRLRILAQTNDGFAVAQKDLELRGPGDLLGTRQSGEAIAGIMLDGDMMLMEEACNALKELESSANEEAEAELKQIRYAADTVYKEKIQNIGLN